MPWEVTDVVDQRREFVLRALDPNAEIAALCREFGISRKTGYKWIERFKEFGEQGLDDLSRRPNRSPLKIPTELALEIVRLRLEHPTWGPKKLREILRKKPTICGSPPAQSTIARILSDAGLVQPRRRRSRRVELDEVTRSTPQKPNDIWTVDFKGWWKTGDKKRCEPLTIRDDFSRFLLDARALGSTGTDTVRPVFEETFSRFGLPNVIRTDNGSPFACTRSPGRLTRLSAWWTALGITLDPITPGSPQENGGHERMHRDIAAEVQKAPRFDLVAQQRALDEWRLVFNTERPHEALSMKTPADLYKPSEVSFTGKRPVLTYPEHFLERMVSSSGSIKIFGKDRFVSESLISWPIGLEPTGDELIVWFAEVCLGVTNSDFTKPLSARSRGTNHDS